MCSYEILSCSWLSVVLERKADFALTCEREKYILPFYTYKTPPEACHETRKMVLQRTHCNTGKESKSTKLHYCMIKLWIEPPQIVVLSLPSPVCAWLFIFFCPHQKKAAEIGCFSEVFQFKVFLRCMYISCSAKYLRKLQSKFED